MPYFSGISLMIRAASVCSASELMTTFSAPIATVVGNFAFPFDLPPKRLLSHSGQRCSSCVVARLPAARWSASTRWTAGP